MCIYRSSEERFHICTFKKGKNAYLRKTKKGIYGSSLPYMRILSKVNEHFFLPYMSIYGISLLYMYIFPFVYARIQKPKCAYTEDLFHLCLTSIYVHLRKTEMYIYGRELLNMCILSFVYAHLRKPKCVYKEALFRICAYTEESFCICAFWLRKWAYTEESFPICAFWLLYMHIYRRQNVHIWKRAFVYAHVGFCICAFWLPSMCIYETLTERTRCLGRFDNGTDEEHKGEMSNWVRTCIMGVGRSTLGHDGDV
jgi:hypothetical protein